MGDVVDINKEWFGDNGDRARYQFRKGEERTHVNVRVPTHLVRFIDEYVASRTDQYCLTRSDAINDAILLWVGSVKENGLAGIKRAADRIELKYYGYQQEEYDILLKDLEQQIDKAVRDRNQQWLRSILITMKNAQTTFTEHSGEVQIQELSRLITRVEEIFKREST